jgi:uncharacterized protein (TIGR02231 family)
MTSRTTGSAALTAKFSAAATAVLFLAVAGQMALAAQKTTARSRITSVVVYSDRAVVTRSLSVKVPAGRSLIVVNSLIPNLDRRTLKCLPAGKLKGVKVVDINSELYPLTAPNREDLADLEKRSTKLSARIRTAEDQIVALHERTRVLAEYRKLTSRAMREGLISAKPKLAEWLKASKFISAQALAATTEIRKLEGQKFELSESLKVLSARINGIRNPSAGQACKVRLALECRRAGRFDLELSYLVRGGVRWGPKYDVRLDRKSGKVELTRIGVVRQQTGEDWTNALIRFSTRSPAKGLRPPEFRPVLLGALKRANRVSTLTSREVKEDAPLEAPAGPAARPGDMAAARPVAPPGVGAAPRAAPAAGREVPHLKAGGEVVEFSAREKISVRSDGKPVLVPLGSWKSRCDWGLECIPKLLGSVYIRGRFVNPTGALLLPGPGECYVDGEYIGKIRVPVSPAGSRVQLSFGAVEGLSVTRQAEPLRGRRGRGYHYVYRIELVNSSQKPVSVTLLEAIPVSTVKAVTVTLEKETTPCEKLSGGKLRWKLKLAPGQRKEIRLAYRVDISRAYRY